MHRSVIVALCLTAAIPAGISAWIAFPTPASLQLKPPLVAWTPAEVLPDTYAQDFESLTRGFTPQRFRSFCGPASIATVLNAYGSSATDQVELLPTIADRLETFYTGMTLGELAQLANDVGLDNELRYADSLDLDAFRDLLKLNLQQKGDYVLINYDRRKLSQAGAGHISAVGAYDPARDAFLVLDEASFKYPFTWIPTGLLYEATRTKDGSDYRGILTIRERRVRG